jgi:hypothetical protein
MVVSQMLARNPADHASAPSADLFAISQTVDEVMSRLNLPRRLSKRHYSIADGTVYPSVSKKWELE